jgi:hypothetical protein
MSDIRIVIAQRGWVFVGRYEINQMEVVIRDAKCIRQWGTTKGLGELVNGPTPNTVLDHCGTVRLHPLQIVATIDVNSEKWDAVLRT